MFFGEIVPVSEASGKKNSSQEISLRGQGGQIIVEYVLLLVVGVSVAVLITSTMVSRNPDSPGFLVKKWLDIIQAIGKDTPDDLAPQP
jgi:hypothetical protein